MEILILTFLYFVARSSIAVAGDYSVVDFGAVGDGKTDDSQKFLSAWAAACKDSGSPTLVIPSGKTFLLSTTTFSGPCQSSIHVQILGNLVAPGTTWKAQPDEKWISFHNVNGLTVDGAGTVDGQGSAWWSCKDCSSIPDMFGCLSCNNYKLSGVTFSNAQGKHVTVYGSVGVHIDSITIKAPETSPNTDGIHIEKCQQVQISSSNIASGDDCIGIGGGTSVVNISHITCGPGHGISVGSLGEGGSQDQVEQVHVSFCQLTKTQNGARIKTWQGGSGYAKGIIFEHINVTSVGIPIRIDQYYPSSSGTNQSAAVQISDVSFIGIVGTSSKTEGIDLSCSESVACTGITLQDINIQSDQGATLAPVCINAHGTTSGNVSPAVPCLK